MNSYRNATYDEERALYGIHDAEVEECVFDGPADGESALKEAGRIRVSSCDFRLRYPLWHVESAEIAGRRMTETCRAALWYDRNIVLKNCELSGIKAVRECSGVKIESCSIQSQEFGWYSHGLSLVDTELVSEYPFLNSRGIEATRVAR